MESTAPEHDLKAGRLPQTASASEPLQAARHERPSRWAVALLWASIAIAALSIVLFASSFLT